MENPTDDQVEEFLKQVAGHLPKEQGTPISKTPVNVTLQGKICNGLYRGPTYDACAIHAYNVSKQNTEKCGISHLNLKTCVHF